MDLINILKIFNLPNRDEKPRKLGLTIILDQGLPFNLYLDYIETFHKYIDFIKFGWCTSILTSCIKEKIKIAHEYNIGCFLGGTFFEKAFSQNSIEKFIDYVQNFLNLNIIEISNGTIPIDKESKYQFIKKYSSMFRVFSEVGYKDVDKCLKMAPAEWIECIKEDLSAGAEFVITESRESGKSGICRENGEVRYGLVKEIINSEISPEKIIWEAPNKNIQTFLISEIGTNINLANISFSDIVPLETLRLGLRSETLNLFD